MPDEGLVDQGRADRGRAGAALAAAFEGQRPRLRAVAQRLLGTAADAEDAVQDTWLRASQADLDGVVNLGGWLTTTLSRICLDQLRRRARAGTDPWPSGPEPLPVDPSVADPADDAVLAESVRAAFLVVLDTLAPAERTAFVLHDAFGVPFTQIAVVLGRSPGAAKKLAGRARVKLRSRGPARVEPDTLAGTRPVVEAFVAAVRAGDLAALTRLLAPDVVRRADPCLLPAGAPVQLRGRSAVLEEAGVLAHRASAATVALVDGALGAAVLVAGQPRLVLRLVVVGRRVAALEVVGDPRRLRGLAVTPLR